MSPIDWPQFLQVVPSAALAIIFGWFILKMLDRQDKKDTALDVSRSAQDDKRDGEWRDYLSAARGSYVDSVAAMASEIKGLAMAMVSTHDSFVQHDAWSRSEAVRRDAVTAATAAAVASEATKVAAEVASRAAIAAIDLRYRQEDQDRQKRLDRPA